MNAVLSPSRSLPMLLSMSVGRKSSSPMTMPTNVPRMPRVVSIVGA